MKKQPAEVSDVVKAGARLKKTLTELYEGDTPRAHRFSAITLGVFLFVMTAIVYETQHRTNPGFSNYVDALYFTVTALTTTGFGDVVLPGTTGRLISVVIMVFGVSLFLRLVQVMLRPSKVEHTCPDCGLKRHDYDAVHCKACGRLLNIEDEGLV